MDKDAYEMLGYEDDEDDVDEEDIDVDDDEQFQKFKTKTWQDAAHVSEAQRQQGGVKTQNACVHDWNVSNPALLIFTHFFQLFIEDAKRQKQVKDDMVDEHSLLLYIKHSALHPKRDRKGNPIPGTLVGAVSFFVLYVFL